MINMSIFVLVFISLLSVSFAPPVTHNKDNEQENEVGGLEDYVEYNRYLREVVNALESDPDFRKKLEKAAESDIKSGKIAEELEFVSHHVRTRLDEIKRIELERLKQLTEKKLQIEKEIGFKDTHGHLDNSNPHTFEIEDLKKLIAKTTQDLAEADNRRRQEFKEYELHKEFEKQKKLNETNGTEREKIEKEFQEREMKHKQHEKLHEPGHKAQLEEVWEKQDQMQQEFDPKMFFMLHDIDGNGLWDQDEVKALFIKELDKMYQAGAPEDDMRERAEEMERMRETVFKEVDLNKDGFIDYEEFLAQTRRNDFQQDHGWQSLDEQRPYTDEELAEYVRQHQMNMMAQGYPPNQAYYPNPNHPQAYGHMPQQPVYQQGYNQMPQAQYHPADGVQPPPQQMHHPNLNTNEVYQGHPPQGSYQQHPQFNQAPVNHANMQPPPNQRPQQHYQQANHQFQQPNQVNQQQPSQVNQQYQQPNQVNQQQPNQVNQQYQQPNQVNQQQASQVNQQYQQVNAVDQHQQPNQLNHQSQQQNQQQNNMQFQQPNAQHHQANQQAAPSNQQPEQIKQSPQMQSNEHVNQGQQNIHPVPINPANNIDPQVNKV